jgi:hypothetical protein
MSYPTKHQTLFQQKPDPSWLIDLHECPSKNETSIELMNTLDTMPPNKTEPKPEDFICPTPACPAEGQPVCDQEGTVHK